MPIPHMVTEEFFLPSEENEMIGGEVFRNFDRIDQSMNELYRLFNLIQNSVGGRDSSNENSNATQSEYSEFRNSRSGSNFFERLRLGVLNYWQSRQNEEETNQNEQFENQEQN